MKSTSSWVVERYKRTVFQRVRQGLAEFSQALLKGAFVVLLLLLSGFDILVGAWALAGGVLLGLTQSAWIYRCWCGGQCVRPVFWVVLSWLAILVGTASAGAQLDDLPPGRWEVSEAVGDGAMIAVLTGSISRGNAGALLRETALREVLGRPLDRLCLDSPGGETFGGILIGWIAEKKELPVITKECASACAVVLAASPDATVLQAPAGDNQWAVGLHRSTAVAPEGLEGAGNALGRWVDSLYAAKLTDYGISDALIDAAANTPGDGMHYPSVSDLIAGGLVDRFDSVSRWEAYCSAGGRRPAKRGLRGIPGRGPTARTAGRPRSLPNAGLGAATAGQGP